MTQSAAIENFTRQLSELVGNGIPIRTSLGHMQEIPSAHQRVRRIASEIGTGLEEGRTLSAVLASCGSVCFPQWYTAFVGAAEENGCMPETLAFLSRTLHTRQKARASFFAAMVYPAIVVLLCLLCSVGAAVLFPQFFAKDTLSYRNGAAGSFFFASLFLVAVVLLAAVVLRLVTQTNPCVSLMNALAFLTDKGASLSKSLECVVPVVEKNERLCGAVLDIREHLLRGESVEKAFCDHLEEAGFASAARLVSSHIALAQSGGERNAFARTAEGLSERIEKVRSAVLSCEQPVLLCCAALYMLILLRNTLMPYMTGLGV